MIGEERITEQTNIPVTNTIPTEEPTIKAEIDEQSKAIETVELLKQNSLITDADFVKGDEEIMKDYHLNECNLESLKDLRKCFYLIYCLLLRY